MAKKRIKIKNDCRPKIPKFSKIGAKVGGNSKFSFSWWKFYFKFSNSSGLLLNFQLKEFEAINFLKLESEMKNLKPGSMSRLMWSLGRLNIMPSQNFLTIFYDQFAKLGTECKAQDVALCMEGIVKLGLKPNQRFFFTYSGVFPLVFQKVFTFWLLICILRFMEAWQNAAISKMEEIWPESWVTFPGNLQRCDFKPSRTFWDSFLKIGQEKLKELVTSANMIAVLEGLRLHK